MPAGLTYWQKKTFRLYHHNPPLVKLAAALPVLWSSPVMDPLYNQESWLSPHPSQSTFSQTFAYFNAQNYFEMFQRARLVMPLFSIIGGLVVFFWSRDLYGSLGGLLSLALWVFCPNILAHGRLITSDVGSASMGVLATYAFWRYMNRPGWKLAAIAGVLLGLAQLTKFTLLVLFVIWPFLWAVRLALTVPRWEWRRRSLGATGHALLIVGLCVLTIDCGYFFEGVGIPLGKFEFGSKSLTRSVAPGAKRPHSKNEGLEAAWQFRVNRFRGSWLEGIPCPLPEHYVLGFDEQKIETEGVPLRFFRAINQPDPAERARRIAREQETPESSDDERAVYPVYLNGDLSRTGGWWYYFAAALLYKVPEGTWLLVIMALASLRLVPRGAADWADEITLWTVPLVVLLSMSLLTDINLGLRYVLAAFPFVFIATGKLIPWMLTLPAPRRRVMTLMVLGAVGSTAASVAWIHPHYLAYFNWASGGPDRRPARLIDSNLDWGQDLVGLQKWWKLTIPGQPIGLAYFGQINPSIFKLRGDAFDWFLAPVRPGVARPLGRTGNANLIGPAATLKPGYYAVSATLLYGLPWRHYDSASLVAPQAAWEPRWTIFQEDAFWYFRQFEPVARIGHSIYIYHLTADDVAGAAPLFMARDKK
jgi:4-amino-4-deoxy-L-arabinose transferase-like glycosyltransferase